MFMRYSIKSPYVQVVACRLLCIQNMNLSNGDLLTLVNSTNDSGGRMWK